MLNFMLKDCPIQKCKWRTRLFIYGIKAKAKIETAFNFILYMKDDILRQTTHNVTRDELIVLKDKVLNVFKKSTDGAIDREDEDIKYIDKSINNIIHHGTNLYIRMMFKNFISSDSYLYGGYLKIWEETNGCMGYVFAKDVSVNVSDYLDNIVDMVDCMEDTQRDRFYRFYN